MSKTGLQVKFLKSTTDLDFKEGGSRMGANEHNDSYIYRANDGNVYLMASIGAGAVTRYHFHRGDVSGAFSNERIRQKYMDTINKAAGETVVVAAEAA